MDGGSLPHSPPWPPASSPLRPWVGRGSPRLAGAGPLWIWTLFPWAGEWAEGWAAASAAVPPPRQDPVQPGCVRLPIQPIRPYLHIYVCMYVLFTVFRRTFSV